MRKLGDPVQFMIQSPDGLRLATVNKEARLRLWNAATGQEVTQFKGQKPVSAITFSPDGKTLVTAEPTTVQLWDVPHRPGASNRRGPGCSRPFRRVLARRPFHCRRRRHDSRLGREDRRGGASRG